MLRLLGNSPVAIFIVFVCQLREGDTVMTQHFLHSQQHRTVRNCSITRCKYENCTFLFFLYDFKKQILFSKYWSGHTDTDVHS